MSRHSPIKAGSLLERATNIYDFGAALRGAAAPAIDVPRDAAPAPAFVPETAFAGDEAPAPRPMLRPWTGPMHPIDREALTEAGFVLPDGPVSGISEEFRIVKRQLLDQLGDGRLPNAGRVLVCSAHSGEGKTFCAVNLALSLAAEKDVEVLLVDADFANPTVLTALGLPAGPGLMDVLADPSLHVEDVVIRTDIPSLAVLPAGQQTNNDTEYLASERTRQLLAALTEGRPHRIVIFDSPPLLAASPAAVLARHVAMALLVVRADRTSENALRDAASLLKGCPSVQLILNGIKFTASGRRFGSYYGKGI
jgi:protein-tyrosine kinase